MVRRHHLNMIREMIEVFHGDLFDQLGIAYQQHGIQHHINACVSKTNSYT